MPWWDELSGMWWRPGASAPPLQAVLSVAGWAQQTSLLPWLPISPFTIVTEGKHETLGNHLEPITFQWIAQNDARYVKSVLNCVRNHRTRNMKQLYMYLREHYEPECWRECSELEEMQEQLASWRQNRAGGQMGHTRMWDAFQLEAVASKMTSTAARATAHAARGTAEAEWMTAEAARVTREAARIATSGSLDGAATIEPLRKKAKI